MKKQAAAKGKTESKKQTTPKNNKAMKTENNKTENKTVVKEVKSNDKLVLLPPSMLEANPKNPRIKYEEIEELMNSIVENGLIDPLTGYYKNGKVILKDGHRRKMAIDLAISKGNKIAQVKVLIVDAPTEEQETLDYILHNDGKPLNMLEQSVVIKRLLNFGWKVTDIEKKTGKARGYIDNLIILTKLPMKVYNLIAEDKISAHAVITIVAAVKGDEAKLIEAVEDAIKTAKAAGKEKATPKHLTAKVKGPSHGKFYKFAEEILNLVAGQKATRKDREDMLSYVIVAYENGQRPKDVADRYFTDKTKVTPETAKAEKPEAKAPAKAAPKKAEAKKPAKKAAKKK